MKSYSVYLNLKKYIHNDILIFLFSAVFKGHILIIFRWVSISDRPYYAGQNNPPNTFYKSAVAISTM